MRLGFLLACAILSGCEMTPPAAWTLPLAGDIIAVAQSGAGINSRIERDFLVCADAGRIPASVIVYQADGGGSANPAYPNILLPPGKCLQVARPSAIFLASRQQGNDVYTVSGTLRAFRPGRFRDPPVTVDRPHDQPASAVASKPALLEAVCDPVPSPSVGQNIYSTCPIREIVVGRNYRICFARQFTPPQPNGEPYPTTLAPLVLSRDLMTRPVPPTPDQTVWNPIAADSCRDIYNAQFAGFVIWPWRTDPNDQTWQPEIVSKVMFTLQRLPD